MAQDLESAAAAQTAGMQADQVMDLVLDTCKATKVTGLEKFSNLRTLTLNGCGLTTLEGFPTLPALRKLELRDNNLSDGLEALQDAALFQLKSLSLAGNKFATLEDLEPLVRACAPTLHCPGPALAAALALKRPPLRSQSSLPNLKDLDLFNCPITEVDNYRSGLFDMLPSVMLYNRACVTVTNVAVLDNPARFENPFQFEVSFECIAPIPDDIEWKLTCARPRAPLPLSRSATRCRARSPS